MAVVADVQSSVAVEEMTLHAFVLPVEPVTYVDVVVFLWKVAVFVLLQEQELPTAADPNEC